ncbi:hypothetical protein A3743_16325 [Oleiphilus sp. HI0072]|nr:hypothetical protein A3743_16325 [Oleiphilus sp. HI0072]
MPNLNEALETIDSKFNEFKGDFEALSERLDEFESRANNQQRRPNQGYQVADASAGTEKETDQCKDEIEATKRYLQTGSTAEFEKRGLSISGDSGTKGGAMVVPALSNELDKLLEAYNPLRANCTVVNVESTTYDKLVSTGGTAAARKKELDTRTETAAPNLSKVSIPLYELSAYPMTTNELLSSSSFDVMAWLSEEVASAMATTENQELINGTGSTDGQMQGILTYTQSTDPDSTRTFGELQYTETASATAIAADELISVIYSLAQPYRASAKWYMSTEAIEAARKLKDSNGAYIWRDPIGEGQTPMLGGYEVVEVAALETLAATNVPVFFGDLNKAYHIADNLRHRFIITDQVTKPGWTKVFVSTMSGGGIVDSNAIKLLKMAAA